nr:MAG TPA: hypothetical protein [Caudoviricetes sp.]
MCIVIQNGQYSRLSPADESISGGADRHMSMRPWASIHR